jgi:ubiquinone biosynthesis protein UbiJ
VLDLAADPVALTAALVDVASVSGDEQRITDSVDQLDATTQAIAGTQQAVEQLEQRVDQLEQTPP